MPNNLCMREALRERLLARTPTPLPRTAFPKSLISAHGSFTPKADMILGLTAPPLRPEALA